MATLDQLAKFCTTNCFAWVGVIKMLLCKRIKRLRKVLFCAANLWQQKPSYYTTGPEQSFDDRQHRLDPHEPDKPLSKEDLEQYAYRLSSLAPHSFSRSNDDFMKSANFLVNGSQRQMRSNSWLRCGDSCGSGAGVQG
jgi:hypothetical protein